MRQAVEAARMDWALCTIAGVAGKGEVLEVVPRVLDLDSLVTRRVSLDGVNEAFAAMERQEGIRTVITF